MRRTRTIPSLVLLVLLVFFVCAGSSSAQTYEPRFSAGYAYDAERSRLVVFGGFYRGEYPSGTWEWDGARWLLVSVDGPPARNSPAMAWDARRRVVVMFGGDTRNGPLGDTWEWDGATWRRVATSGPPPRTLHRMAFDPHRGQVVLFGGLSGESLLADTWSWDGYTWREVATEGPPARALHALASEPGTGRLLMFGGMAELGPEAPKHDDTWLWDGDGWIRADVVGPPARDHVQAVGDPMRGWVVMHGGSGAVGERWLRDTWIWSDGRWAHLSAGPAIAGHNLYFDAAKGAPSMFGGFGPDGTTAATTFWIFDGASWVEPSSRPGDSPLDRVFSARRSDEPERSTIGNSQRRETPRFLRRSGDLPLGDVSGKGGLLVPEAREA